MMNISTNKYNYRSIKERANSTKKKNFSNENDVNLNKDLFEKIGDEGEIKYDYDNMTTPSYFPPEKLLIFNALQLPTQ